MLGRLASAHRERRMLRSLPGLSFLSQRSEAQPTEIAHVLFGRALRTRKRRMGDYPFVGRLRRGGQAWPYRHQDDATPHLRVPRNINKGQKMIELTANAPASALT